MMSILLTGGTGQIGFELRSALASLGRVIAVSRNEMDLLKPDTIAATLDHHCPDLIINAAAYTQVDRAESEPGLAQSINGDACGILAEQAVKIGCPLIHYSTDYVFDGSASRAYRPDDQTQPLGVYGETKLAGERAIMESGCEFLILRTSWIYSGGRQNFVRTMLRLGEERPMIRVVDDQRGSPTWSRTVARSTLGILRKGLIRHNNRWILGIPSGVFHLTAQGDTTWYEFALKIFDLADLNPRPMVEPISTDAFPTPARRPAYSVLDCSETMDGFGIALPHWEDALDEFMEGGAVAESSSHAV